MLALAKTCKLFAVQAMLQPGKKWLWLLLVLTVHPLEGEKFKINKSKIRGEVSEGMILPRMKLAWATSHDGIMVLMMMLFPALWLNTFLRLRTITLYEIGLTPNRADAVSHLGTARDIAAFLKINIKKPDVSAFKVDNNNLKVEVIVENEQAAPRYSGVTISGVEVKESPKWLKERLAVIGVRSINNIVDATNYVLHDLGQPLHAFDADAIKGNKVSLKIVLKEPCLKHWMM
jgi:phenylalanyl-tRNA synthetase beta chain